MMFRVWVSGVVFALGAAGVAAAAGRPAHPVTRLANYAASRASAVRRATPRFMRLKRHPVVALTFDDLPAGGALHVGETRTGIARRLVAELRANHLEGTYGFLNATGVSDDPDLQEALRVWVAGGMNIGNHTWSHPALSASTAVAYEQNIALDQPALEQYDARRDWHWFRFPYLEEGDTLQKRDAIRDWLHAHGYRVAQVTLNFQDDDWDDPYGRCLAKGGESGIAWLKRTYLENAVEFIQLGREEEKIAYGREVPNVLLLHETDFTTLMLPSLLKLLRSEGFRFSTLPRVERNRVYGMNPNVLEPNGATLPDELMDAGHLRYPAFKPEPVEQLNSLCR